MELYKSIHLLKKKSNWGYDEILDMVPIDFEVFLMMELEDRNKSN